MPIGKYYGRKWLLEILCNDGTKLSMGKAGISRDEELKVIFDVNYPGYEGWYFSEFHIYNMTPETRKFIIQEGAEVSFYAGYDPEPYGLIFRGKVFQALYTRENVVDQKLSLYCMDGERLFKDNFVNSVLRKTEYTDQVLLNTVSSNAINKISIGKISSGVSAAPKVRGVTVFGSPVVYMRDVCRINNAAFFSVNDELQVVKSDDDVEGSYIEVSTKTGLIGTPQQIDYGVNFRVLLNPQIVLSNPQKWVKLDMSKVNIAMQRAQPGTGDSGLVAVLPTDGFFKVIGVHHHGDTRDNDWYTDAKCVSFLGKIPLQLTLPEYLTNSNNSQG